MTGECLRHPIAIRKLPSLFVLGWLALGLVACANTERQPVRFEAPGQISLPGTLKEGTSKNGDTFVVVLGNEYSTQGLTYLLAFTRMAELAEAKGRGYFVVQEIGINNNLRKMDDTTGTICPDSQGWVLIPGAAFSARMIDGPEGAFFGETVVSVERVMKELAPLAYGQKTREIWNLISATSDPCPALDGKGRTFMPWEFYDVVLPPPAESQDDERTYPLRRVREGEFGVSGTFGSYTSLERAAELVGLRAARDVKDRGGERFALVRPAASLNCYHAIALPRVSTEVILVNDSSASTDGQVIYSADEVIALFEKSDGYDAISPSERSEMLNGNVEWCRKMDAEMPDQDVDYIRGGTRIIKFQDVFVRKLEGAQAK